MTVKAVIFDLDGTLTYFNIDYMAARAEVIRLFAEQGLPSSLFSINEAVFEMLQKAKSHMANNGKEEDEFAELRKQVFSIIERYELDAAGKTRLLPNVLKTLKTLKEMKLKMAIFTTNGKKSTSHILRRLGITRFFAAVVTRESVSAVKPDPVHLEAVLKVLNISPEEAMVVGDSFRDVECAQKLTILAVGVATGISSPEALARAGADYLASSVSDIPILVQQLDEKVGKSSGSKEVPGPQRPLGRRGRVKINR